MGQKWLSRRSESGKVCCDPSGRTDLAKTKTQYQCSQCGGVSNKWAGQCPDCGEWNTLVESIAPASSPRGDRFAGFTGERASVQSLGGVTTEETIRAQTGNSELDRVLGGGLVAGSVVLIGGDPGIGKSTLLLQVLAALSHQQRCLYITGEESLQQVALRARRLQLDVSELRSVAETSVEQVLAAALVETPAVMVVDSIQTLYAETLQSAPGSVAQVRESAAALVRLAKQKGITIFLVGHVTKEGGIAGPRVLEHMVDAVLYFEGNGGSRFRVIRALKNRFGAVNELGVFAMTDTGLKPVSNPSAIFLSGQGEQASGSVVMVTREGTRPLLVEIQALVAASHLANPRRLAVGMDGNRLAMLLAVLQRHSGLALNDHDVFVNAVGGIRIAETAADLPILLALLSSFRDRPLTGRQVVFGEVGLDRAS
jgi:DNA repair protein RadA/Sms